MPSSAAWCSCRIRFARSRNGRSLSLTKDRIISTARSNWRMPFSASRSATSFGSFRSAAVSATLCRSSVTVRLLALMQLFVEASDHLAGDQLVLDLGVAVGEAAALLTKLGRRHFDLASPLNQFLEIIGHELLPLQSDHSEPPSFL